MAPTATPVPTAPGCQVLGAVSPAQATVLTVEAQHFVATLHRTFNPTRLALLARRDARQREIDAGRLPDFLPETRAVREDPSWKGAPPAPGLVDRRVEITGPVDAKMVINALNCGATQYMADFEGEGGRRRRKLMEEEEEESWGLGSGGFFHAA